MNNIGKVVLCYAILFGIIFALFILGLYTIKSKYSLQHYHSDSVHSDSSGRYLVSKATIGTGISSIFTSNDYGRTWYSSFKGYFELSSDSSGRYLAAAQYNGRIYISNDYGVTWQMTSVPTAYWLSITSDSTGRYLVAAGNYNDECYVYSSNDYGLNWQHTSVPTGYWTSLTSDSTGRYLFAATGGNHIEGYIYSSNDSGQVWHQTAAPKGYWTSIASDSTGRYLLAATEYSFYCCTYGIYSSNDYGATWQRTSAPGGYLSCVSSDSTGRYLLVANGGHEYEGHIYSSSDYGATWKKTSAPAGEWSSITSDSTGRYLAATQYTGYIFTSNDYGLTWTFVLPLIPRSCLYPSVSYKIGFSYFECLGINFDLGNSACIIIFVVSSFLYILAHLWIHDTSEQYNWQLGAYLFVYTLLPALSMVCSLIYLLTMLFTTPYTLFAGWLACVLPGIVFVYQLRRNKVSMQYIEFTWVLPIPKLLYFDSNDILLKWILTAITSFVPLCINGLFFLLKNGFFILHLVWFVIGYCLFSIQIMSIGNVKRIWCRVFTGEWCPSSSAVDVVELNEQYVGTVLLQSIPMLAIVVFESILLQSYSKFVIVTMTVCSLTIISGLCNYGYYLWYNKPLGDVPLSSLFTFDIEVSRIHTNSRSMNKGAHVTLPSGIISTETANEFELVHLHGDDNLAISTSAVVNNDEEDIPLLKHEVQVVIRDV